MISKGVYGGNLGGGGEDDQGIFFLERGGGGVIGNQNRKLRTDKTV